MNAVPHQATVASAPCVLVVDDDAFQRAMLADMLEELGVATVLQAGDGAAGAAALDGPAPQPAVVVADLCMPGQDGFQLLEALAARRYGGGLILLSGQQESVLQAASALARFHQLHLLGALAKPLRLEALRTALDQLA
ncbi:response regulator [Duganella sp. LX20W]|uniref:Response regulator n=1 Tax=Rugamonas brunnea TaxID=2758569 RepID=A0A7W2EVZ8_9BURK|nr:response regulator [Rugamonas brunnea]MBA5639637.1 response regulator [Rugamonas brunnea]